MSNEAPKAPKPNRHKLALLVFIGVYPLVTILLAILGPLTQGWEVWEKTLILVPIIVTIMVYVLIPLIQKVFKKFLMK